MTRLCLVVALAALAVGCGDDASTVPIDTGRDVGPEDVSTADGSDVDAVADAVDDTTADAADVPLDFTPDPECEADWLVVVDGEAVTDAGDAASDASAQLCVRIGSADGNLVCLRPEPTGEDGSFRVVAPPSARCVGGGSMHVYDYDGTVAPMYCHIDTNNEGGTLELPEPIVLFETEPVAELPPWGVPTEPRTVVFPGDLQIQAFVPDALGFLFTEAEYANLGASRVDPDAAGLCFLTAPVDALWAFRVEGNVKGAFAVRVPNEFDYPAGADVDLYLLGGIETTLPGGAAVAETDWKQYSTGTVSEDGEWIDGQLPAFTWFGYALSE